MELEVLVSKKGTKVVTATNLHLALQLPNHQYATNIKKWINEVYEFKDGIRKPLRLKDFSKRVNKDNPIIDDYYISVELAKLITLNSKSKVKQKYAKYLFSLEDKVENAELLSTEQIKAVIELTKAMSLRSCQEKSQDQHLKLYEQRNGGSAANWWKHRSQILGYSADALRNRLKKLGKKSKGLSQHDMLLQTDEHEAIRTGMIDLFMAMGKSDRFAKNLGDLAKLFAKEFEIKVYDDKASNNLFAPKVKPELIGALKSFRKEGALSIWS
jgi:phage anti-repressor protein